MNKSEERIEDEKRNRRGSRVSERPHANRERRSAKSNIAEQMPSENIQNKSIDLRANSKFALKRVHKLAAPGGETAKGE
jgi:hypothetical protein